MGGFFLAKKSSDHSEALDKARSVFAGKGLELSKTIQTSEFDLLVYNKKTFSPDNLWEGQDGDFVCATGTLMYKGLMGQKALATLYRDSDFPNPDFTKLAGEFALIIRKNQTTRLFTASSGLYHIFRSQNNRFISSSFLALRRAVGDISLDVQSFFEYLLNGAVYGNMTLFNEIKMLDCRSGFDLPSLNPISLPDYQTVNLANLGFDAAVHQVAEDLTKYFEQVQANFGDDICSALSGGYDSRLILGLLRRNQISPYIYVYGSDNSPDVRIARTIADKEGLSLHHTNRANVPPWDPDQYSDLLRSQYYLSDGMTNTGIFNNGQELQTRQERIKHAKLQLNGGGGEIYRNFWLLPDRSFSSEKFLVSKYDRFDYSSFCSSFNKKQYFNNLAEKVQFSAETDSPKLSRTHIAKLYATFRMRYWMGINNSHNAQFAYSLTPFGEKSFVQTSLTLPLAWKNKGRFEAALIRQLDERLASYPSCYGFDFLSGPSFKQSLHETITRNIPVFLRPWLRKRVHKKSRTIKVPRPYYLESEFLKDMGLRGDWAIQKHLKTDQVNSPEVLSRALSVECLLRDEFR